MRFENGQAGAEIEITPAMIEAGLGVYAECNPDLMRPSDIVCGIFTAMYLAQVRALPVAPIPNI